MTINVWGKYCGKVEKLDSANSQRSADYLVGEYRMAFGHDWTIWAGKKNKE